MRIDAHQHFWRYDPVRLDWIGDDMEILQQDWLPAQLAAVLADNGIDQSIVVQAAGSNAETGFLLQQAAAHDWLAGVVGWADLRGDGLAAQLAQWRQAGPLLGIRHQIEDEPACLQDERFDAGVQTVQEQGLIYEVLVNYRQLHNAVDSCARHDRHTLVLDHLAKPPVTGNAIAFANWRRAMTDIAAMPHVVVKASGLVTEAQAAPGGVPDMQAICGYLDAALELFGEDRLLYGSDWTVCRLACTYKEWFTLIDAWACSKPASLYDKLFAANAVRVYNLKETA